MSSVLLREVRHAFALCTVAAFAGMFGGPASYAYFPCCDSAWALRDSVADPHVQSVSLAPADWAMAAPIVSLSSGTLRLAFDYIGPAKGWLRYRFVRCEKDWRRSDARPMEYLAGFEVNTISGYSPSIGATPHYTHYELLFPNRDARLKLSGNYLIQVLDPYDDSVVLLQRQFALSEESLRGELSKSSCSDDDFVESSALELKVGGRALARAPGQISVYCKQSWCDPRYQELRYERTEGLDTWTYGSLFTLRRNGIWNNGAEWRVLDIRSLTLPGTGVERIRSVGGEFHVEATPGEPNSRWKPPRVAGLKGYYSYGEAQGGVARDDAEITASYAYVYFAFKPDGEVPYYGCGDTVLLEIPGVVGAERGLAMRYSEAREQYEATLYMKQGVYSYRYALKTQKGVDYLRFEGSYAETKNEYHLLCYLRGDSDRTDRLVAHFVAGSDRKRDE